MSVKLNDQEKAVIKLLTENGIKFEAILTGELVSNPENKWVRDAFICVFTVNGKSQSFEYSQGIGHRTNKMPVSYKNNRVDYNDLILANKQSSDKSLHNKNQPAWCQKQYIIKPSAASVLFCLLSDSQCGDETFDDFCSNYGYDTDSRKALEIYLTCQETNKKLRILPHNVRSQLDEILQDY